VRRSLLTAAAATAALAAGPGAALAEGASVITASSRVSGEVADRDGPVLDSFSRDSDTAGQPNLSGSALDPEGTARSDADVTFQKTTVVGGERLSSRGSTSATSGDLVRAASSTSGLVAEFTLTEPARYSVTGSLSESNPPGHCCAGGSARLTDDNGDNVFVASINSGEPSEAVASSGTLPPGDYRYQLEASVGFGFGAAASPNIAGTAAFDVSLTLTLPGADGDDDALPDEWETDGVDVDGNGSIDLDLPGMGADPRRKDIFVELDFMPPHRFAPAAGNQIAKAFADAPVTNPDGTTGITLHLDNGTNSVMNPRTGALWGSRSRQSSIPHQDALGSAAAAGYDWGPFDALKAAHFTFARRTVFHYAISAHGHDGTRSGIARDIPSSDLLVTLGAGCLAATGSDCTLDATDQAGTLMHELGHNLGLHHGGDDDLLNKPNYLSVMNYNFQLTGLMRSDLSFVLDFSRFSISLNESALDETHGFGVTSGPAAGFNSMGTCPSGARNLWLVADGPTDFNCDGATVGTVAADVNGDGARTALPPFVDWPALVFDGGAVGGSGVALPSRTPLIEPPLEELEASRKFLEDHVAAQQSPPDPSASPGQAATPTTPTTTPPAATAPLAITALKLRPARFRATRRGPSIRRRGPATVTYTLTSAARVRFTVERRLAGRRRGGRCRAPRTAPRGRRCTRRVRARGSFIHKGAAGANTFRFTGRLAGKRLARGGYRLIAEPIAADGSRGTPRGAAFKIRR
jgi:hypothetical protein